MLTDKVEESRAYGNEEVCELLEAWLNFAKEGKICHVALIAQQLPNILAVETAGIGDCEHAIPTALDVAKIKIWNKLKAKLPPAPPMGEKMTADYVCYNLPSAPMSYDFLTWLINHEMIRVREGAPAPLKVAFTPHQLGGSHLQMYANVIRPLVPMIGGIEEPAALGGNSGPYLSKPIVEAAKRGEKVPLLKAPDDAMAYVKDELKGRTPITITLRELKIWEHRNSNLEAWKKWAKEQEEKGEFVVFVRDTAYASEPIKGFMTFPLAAINIHIRFALYEQAKCNMFVGNGPQTLAMHGTAPYLIFNGTSPKDPFHFHRPAYWRSEFGMEEGEQWPWALPTQKLCWGHDDYENICKHYEALCPLLS